MAKAPEKPTIEEIEAFMNDRKPEWPASFCRFYAEKFWNTYEKSGWRLSAGRGGPVKSWKACFASNWQDIPYPADLAKLQEFQAKELTKKPAQKPVARMPDGPADMDAVLAAYLMHPTHVPQSELASCYDWMKVNIKIKLTREQRDIVTEMAVKDKEKAKATVVGWVFDQMAKEGKNFKSMLQHAG